MAAAPAARPHTGRPAAGIRRSLTPRPPNDRPAPPTKESRSDALPLLAAVLAAAPGPGGLHPERHGRTTATERHPHRHGHLDRRRLRRSPATEAPSGKLTFDVTNDGSQVTEFYLYADDGKRIVGEVENIGPGPHRASSS